MSDTSTNPDLQQQLDVLKEEYIRLLNDKDVLINWGKPQLEALYNTKIGVWLVKRLQAQLRIKALQLKIEKLNSAINTGKEVDLLQIELDVAAKLAEAEAQIMVDVARLESDKRMLSGLESPERSNEIRKLFRALAKQLHPDVNENLTEEQKQIWLQVLEAYENGDLEKLKAISLVYEAELAATAAGDAALTEAQLMQRLQTLKEGIKTLHAEILSIRSVYPFTIEANIKDDAWVAAETEKLKEEIDKLSAYQEELTLEYRQIVSTL